MHLLDNYTEAFFAMVRAGLWERDVRLSDFKNIDYKAVRRLSVEQSVVGLVAAGLEHVVGEKVPKVDALLFAGDVLNMESRNLSMNSFVGDLIKKMRAAGIYTLLIKGQGIAQCLRNGNERLISCVRLSWRLETWGTIGIRAILRSSPIRYERCVLWDAGVVM